MDTKTNHGSLTDVPGVKVGHDTDLEHGTGCTVVLFEAGAVGGLDVRGTASGSREFLALDPLHVTATCHAVCLAGGSAFGLAAADGVMQYLAERNIGYFARVAHVPIVPAAIIFDLSFKDHKVRPDRDSGYRASLAASSGPVIQGSVGAGTGATVGKLLGIERAMKAGVGSAAVRTGEGITVGALAVVNNLGDVRDPATNAIVAGARDPKTNAFIDTARALACMGGPVPVPPGENTNLIVVATDAGLDKANAAKLARMAAAGMARALDPCHSSFDGDVVFAFATGKRPADVNRIGVIAAGLVAEAILRAVSEADGLGVLPAVRDLRRFEV